MNTKYGAGAMKLKLKPIQDQVIVITGASSGIGLVTARMAASKGARVVLAGRDEPDLRKAVDSIRERGGNAVYVLCDVSDQREVRHLCDEATRAFGGFDTWINNAGVSIYGRLDQVSMDDARRLFDVNYWGVVYGSLVAADHLKDRGGAIINLGSVLSDRAVPLQGHYSASKRAVKGFTTALRMELQKSGAPISVSLVKPSSTATPYVEHATSYLDRNPSLPPPVYAPEVVAGTILACVTEPIREISVGGGGLMISQMGFLMPRFMDRFMNATMFKQQKQRGGRRSPILYGPEPGSDRERGEVHRHVMNSSLFTRARLNPFSTLISVLGAGAGLAAVISARRRNGESAVAYTPRTPKLPARRPVVEQRISASRIPVASSYRRG